MRSRSSGVNTPVLPPCCLFVSACSRSTAGACQHPLTEHHFTAHASSIPPDRRLGEKSPQFVNEAARVVALDGVPCVLDPHPAAIGQCPREPLGVLVEKDVALCAAHYQGGAPDVMEGSP